MYEQQYAPWVAVSF